MRFGLWIAREVERIERADIPLWQVLLTFLSAATLRTFLELFSDTDAGQGPAAHFLQFLSGLGDAHLPMMLLHYTLFYSGLLLALTLALFAVTRRPVLSLLRVLCAGFLILLIVPVIDLVWSGGTGFDLSYLTPGGQGSLASLFLTFFGPLAHSGVSPGMRIEVALATLATLAYFLWKRLAWWRAACAALATYAVIFAFIAAPYLTDALFALLGAVPQNSDLAGVRFFGLLMLTELAVLCAMERPALARSLIADLRYMRLAHYSLMLLLGIALSAHAGGFLNYSSETAPMLPLALIAIMAAWAFSVATNNLADVGIDAISNPDRPLVSGEADAHEYAAAAWPLLLAALAAGALAGFAAFFATAVFISSYFIYSMPPLRLKRIPYVSKFPIVLNSFALIAAGFALFNTLPALGVGFFLGGLVAEVPPALLWALPLALLLAANFIDLKDYEGDKAEGIMTLPVLLGPGPAKLLIGGAFLFCYAAIGGLLFSGALLYACIGVGLAEFAFINRRAYTERPVFALYLLSLVPLFFLI